MRNQLELLVKSLLDPKTSKEDRSLADETLRSQFTSLSNLPKICQVFSLEPPLTPQAFEMLANQLKTLLEKNLNNIENSEQLSQLGFTLLNQLRGVQNKTPFLKHISVLTKVEFFLNSQPRLLESFRSQQARQFLNQDEEQLLLKYLLRDMSQKVYKITYSDNKAKLEAFRDTYLL